MSAKGRVPFRKAWGAAFFRFVTKPRQTFALPRSRRENDSARIAQKLSFTEIFAAGAAFGVAVAGIADDDLVKRAIFAFTVEEAIGNFTADGMIHFLHGTPPTPCYVRGVGELCGKAVDFCGEFL